MAVTTLPDGRVVVYYNDRATKKRVKEYFGRGPAAESRANRRNAELGLRKGRPPRARYGPTVATLADAYYYAKGFDRKPRESLSYRLNANILPAIGHRHAMALTHEHLDDYVALRRRDGVKDNSISREITDIKAILSWASRRRPPLVPINPVAGFQPPRIQDKIFLPPAPAELDAIFEKAQPHLQRFIAMACFIGARPGATELLSLTWASVAWDRRIINVMSADKGGPPRRSVPIHDELIAMLKAWHKSDQDAYGEKAKKMAIIHYYGKTIKSIKRAWRAAVDGAGITRRIRPYDLRHRFVTLALENGADIGALADIVGSRPETLRKHYQHVTAELHRRTVNRINLGTSFVPKKTP